MENKYTIEEIFDFLNKSNYEEDDVRLLEIDDMMCEVWSQYMIYDYNGGRYFIPRGTYDAENYIKRKYAPDDYKPFTDEDLRRYGRLD